MFLNVKIHTLILSHLKDSSDDKNVVSRQRKSKLAAVQRVPQLPDRPSPRRPAEDPPRPRTLAVQERQHVLTETTEDVMVCQRAAG